MSSFVAFQAPVHAALRLYDRSKPYDQQSDAVPSIFLDAMSVREEVFVKEQSVPLANELDEDDPRCYHWVVYASVGTSAQPSASKELSMAPTPPSDVHAAASGQRKGSDSNKLPVGTIRLVPPPHGEDEDRSSHTLSLPANAGLSDAEKRKKGCLRRGREPYVKLGRLAVLREFRKLFLSRLLLDAALEYASTHADEILPPVSPTVAEGRRIERGEEEGASGRSEGAGGGGGGGGAGPKERADGAWEGLVLVHAQVGVEKVWARWGFVTDETMGRWDEEGIQHCGMWRRLNVSSTPPPGLAPIGNQ